jgi:hypothetical protein
MFEELKKDPILAVSSPGVVGGRWADAGEYEVTNYLKKTKLPLFAPLCRWVVENID